MSSIKINKDESKRVHIWIKSAIGTPNRRQFKHKNIMYPYFRMYKSPYRARDSRTRQAFWPCVDKYPWHTHQKRWVNIDQLNIKFFSEFTNKEPSRKNLFETCHTLPFNGINCLFWNPIYLNSHKFFLKKNKNDENGGEDNMEENDDVKENTIEGNDDVKENAIEGYANDNMNNHNDLINQYNENKKVIKINDFHYIVDKDVKNNTYFYLKYIKYSMRPFRGKLVGDIYLNQTKIRHNISAKGFVNGEWKYSYPHININNKIEHISLNNNLTSNDIYSNNINNLVVVDKYTYRPPLPQSYVFQNNILL
ncbi:conserved Plasmodium protein, unknown function [Plasmodium sp. gorilla clade G3]|nr:conserved Plasmodium protein, unknown function [Plasmodium sp. gorilla clade G3]